MHVLHGLYFENDRLECRDSVEKGALFIVILCSMLYARKVNGFEVRGSEEEVN